MAEREVFDAAAEERRWWEEWFDRDYSWEGLGKLNEEGLPEKPWRGWVVVKRGRYEYCEPEAQGGEQRAVRPASLQDYWRADPEADWRLRSLRALRKAGEITDSPFGEKHWHIVHLPARLLECGVLNWKADKDHQNWNLLERILSIRLRLSGRTKFNRINRDNEEFKVVFDGAVIARSLSESAGTKILPNLSLNYSAHIFSSEYNETYFMSDLTAKNSYFSEKANFSGSRFIGENHFNRSIFSKGVEFRNAMFGGNAAFNESIFYASANFYNAIFIASAGFSNSKFTCDVRFKKILVCGPARFFCTIFLKEIEFSDSSFLDLFTFSWKGLDEPGPRQKVAKIRFRDVLCLRRALFSCRVFDEAPQFADTEFHSLAIFDRATMHEGVNLTGTKFAFDSDLELVAWERIAERLKRENETVPLPKNLGEAGDPAEKLDTVQPITEKSLDPVSPEIEAALRLAFWRAAYKAWQEYLRALSTQQTPAARFESSYRRLKLLMRGIGAHIEEQRFFALELRARKARTDDDIKRWEKLAADAYGKLADYGQSALRPLLWLGASIIVFASAYNSLAYSACAFNNMSCSPSASVPLASTEPPWIDARPAPVRLFEKYAAQPFVGVIAHWSDAPRRCFEKLRYLPGPLLFTVELGLIPVSDPIGHHTWAKSLSEQNTWQSGVFAFLRMTQRLISLILIFLTALALRRRFQIG